MLRVSTAMFFLAVAGGWQAIAQQSAIERRIQATTLPVTRFHHVHMNAADPEASVRFYATRFGLTPTKFADQDALWTPNGWLLFEKAADVKAITPTSAFWHLGWGPKDTKAYYERLVLLGTPFETPLTPLGQVRDSRQSHYAYVQGPDLEQIELFAEAGTDQFEHLHMRSADPATTSAWYTKYFIAPKPPPGPPFSISPSGVPQPTWIDHIAFRWFVPASGAAPDVSRGHVLDHFAFSVEDLQTALDQLRHDGVTVLQLPQSILDSKVSSAFIEGPDGVAIELVEDHTRQTASVK